MSNIKNKLDDILDFNDKERLEEMKQVTPDIIPVIKELCECNYSTGKKKMVEACRKLICISESNEACAKSFMKTLLNKAIPKIGKLVMEKVEKGKYKDSVIAEKD